MNGYVDIDSKDFAKLVKGEMTAIPITGGSGALLGEACLRLDPKISFNMMLEAVKEAINEKDKTKENPDSGPALS